MTTPKIRIMMKYIELLKEIIKVQTEFLDIYGFTEEFETWKKSWREQKVGEMP